MAALRKIDADLCTLDYDAFTVPGGTAFPTRMTVVRRSDGGVWLYSPVPIDDGAAAEIEALGPVRDILAPNCYHHLFARAAADRWPDARLWIARGLESKNPQLSEGRPVDESAPWRAELDCVEIQGAPAMNELVCFHRASGSVILADLVFHWGKPRGWKQFLLFHAMGIADGLRQSRLWRLIAKDRKAAAASCEAIFQWPIRRIIPCHGAVVENASAAMLRAAVNKF